MVSFFKGTFIKNNSIIIMGAITFFLILTLDINAHGVTEGDKGFIQ